MRIFTLIVLLLGSSIGFSVNAHHAATGLYDRNNIGEISGKISSIFWRNPHVRLGVTRVGDNGDEQEWEVEFGSVNTVERLGVTRDQLDLGDQVVISGSMGRNGRQVMFADELTLSSGEELVLQAPSAARYGLTEDALSAARLLDADLRSDIFRVWLPADRPRTGYGTTEYPLTSAGMAGQANWDAADDPALKCSPPGLPTAMDNPYPIEFIDQGDSITMRLEEWDGVRTFHMGSSAEGEQTPSLMGYSIGNWDGDTLVVTTSDISWPYVDDLGTPQSAEAVVVERFTMSADGTRLDWHAEITDPVNFTEPVVMTGNWVWIPGHEVKPFNCALSDEL